MGYPPPIDCKGDVSFTCLGHQSTRWGPLSGHGSDAEEDRSSGPSPKTFKPKSILVILHVVALLIDNIEALVKKKMKLL